MTENPLVDYISSLRTQVEGANPSYIQESRAAYLHLLRERAPEGLPDDEALHVASGLDDLVKKIHCGEAPWNLIILTGDAGDGKTQACARLAALWGVQLDPVTQGGDGWVIVKDASEVAPGELSALLEDWTRSQPGPTPRRLLMAINEGRLRRIGRALKAIWAEVIEPSLDGRLDKAGAADLDAAMVAHRTLVLNFRHRLFVRKATRGLLESWTAARFWEEGAACSSCPSQGRCPILANAVDLRNAARVERMSDLLTWLHLAGQRLPFRRLQGILAFAFTGGLRCADVHRAQEPGPRLLRHRYYAAVFATDEADPGLLIRTRPEPASALLRALDPACMGDQDLDKALIEEWQDRRAESGPEAELQRAGNVLSSEVLPELRRRHLFEPLLDNQDKAPWRQALDLLDKPTLEPLRSELIRSLNWLNGHRENASVLLQNLPDPEGLLSYPRHAIEFALPADVSLSVVSGPAIPREVQRCFDDVATTFDLVATELPGRPALVVDVVLLERLRSVLHDLFQPVALGTHRNDIHRFLARVVEAAAPNGASIVLRHLGERLHLRVDSNCRLTLENV